METIANAVLGDALEATASPGVSFHLSGGSVRMTPPDLLDAAERAAERLAGLGVRRGDRVGLLGPNRPEWVTWAYGIWRAGATLVPLPFHLFIRNQEAFARNICSLASAAGCRLAIASPDFLRSVPEGLGIPWDVPERNDGPMARPDRPESGDIAVIQYTSGSTAAPKGASLSHRGILEAIRIVGEGCSVTPASDRYAGWLPFFHDWGLFGYVVRPLVLGCEADLLPTERFARNPVEWFRVITRAGATITSGPSSAYEVAWRAAGRDGSGIDLSSLRICEHGAETIDPRVLDLAETVGVPLGLNPGALAGAFGMAEVTLGASITPIGVRCPVDEVDPSRLGGGHASPAWDGSGRKIASCGLPLPEVSWRIAGEDGPLPERQVGELQLRSPSVMEGYWQSEDQPFEDGWLKTGDLGYLADGSFHYVSRAKDIVIAFGRNYAPDDFEWAAGRVAGVRKGRVVAFAGPGGEDHVIVAVEAEREADPSVLAHNVLEAVADEVGHAPHQVVVVPKGTITKTTSGKPQRSALRRAYAEGELPELLGSAAAGAVRIDP
jgi:fatty-acyl-CoA synthase